MGIPAPLSPRLPCSTPHLPLPCPTPHLLCSSAPTPALPRSFTPDPVRWGLVTVHKDGQINRSMRFRHSRPAPLRARSPPLACPRSCRRPMVERATTAPVSGGTGIPLRPHGRGRICRYVRIGGMLRPPLCSAPLMLRADACRRACFPAGYLMPHLKQAASAPFHVSKTAARTEMARRNATCKDKRFYQRKKKAAGYPAAFSFVNLNSTPSVYGASAQAGRWRSSPRSKSPPKLRTG